MKGRSERAKNRSARRGYDRAAPFYDLVGQPGEWLGAARWRRRQWSHVVGRRILEVGVGTGRNFPYYPPGQPVIALDLSRGMLRRAQAKVRKGALPVQLLLADGHALPFPDRSFDCLVFSFVFCSIDEPQRVMAEAWRVLEPGGRVVLLEHTLSYKPILHWGFKTFDFVGVWLCGDHINREPHKLLTPPCWRLLQVEDLFLDIVKVIVAEKA